MRKIPRCMSTQHPDNVSVPFFAENKILVGEDEIREAYYAFSHLGCDEQMWDCEGKEVDGFVVRKLLTNYEHYFQSHRLGQDLFLTLRVPNPSVEKAETKVLLETLESIPRSFDCAKLFYKDDIVPIFEVILPMTTSPKCLKSIYFNFEEDLRDALGYFNPAVSDLLPGELSREIKKALTIIDYRKDGVHQEATDQVLNCLKKEAPGAIQEHILRAAHVRKFLG